MATSLPKSELELKSLLQGMDKYVLEKALEWGRKWFKSILETIDELISKQRDRELEIEHRREVWYQTCLGAVKVERREYRESHGRNRCLLDEVMGMEKYRHMTRSVQELALDMASKMPYRRAAEVLRKTSGIFLAHQTIWRMVAQIADPCLKQAERELKWFMKTGEIPEGEGKEAAHLLIEADGVMVSLQREKQRKAEVKVGIAYEGWEKVGKDRYRTVNKTSFAAITGRDSFWAAMSLRIHQAYNLAKRGEVIIGGDGAAWVREGASYMNGRFQLDRYHLNRELCTALGHDNETKHRVKQACYAGEVETGLKILADLRHSKNGEQAQRLAHAYHYLADNRAGLEDYRLKLGKEGLRRTGAMEGNVDKLIARRMKNQGMSWTIQGLRRLLYIRFLVLEGKLGQCLQKQGKPAVELKLTRRKVGKLVTRLSSQEPDAWIKAGLPALQGPHSSHPWALALKSLTETQTL